MVCKCGCPLFEGEIMCPDCLRPVEQLKLDRIEFKNGSIIGSISNTSEVTRSKRGQEQINNMKSAWDLIDEYYNSLPFYKKIITKIQWLFDDVVGFFIRLYYKIVIKILYRSK